MIRKRWIGAAAAVFVLGGVAVGIQRCQPIDLTVELPADRFLYTPHERPRVFVSHHPLNPAPNTDFKIRLTPEVPDGVRVESGSAVLDGGAPQACLPAADDVLECTFNSGAEGLHIYSGFVQLSDGRRVGSRTSYRFQVLVDLPPKGRVEARVPVKPQAGLTANYSIDTAFTRDPQGYELVDFRADVERVVYEGMLADPVYRWRDDQLGFHVYNQDAIVSSYYSKLDTRCGQNPWPLAGIDSVGFPVALASVEVVGVLHRRATDGQGIEGNVSGATAGLFRDCAGTARHRSDVRTFSATMGLAQSPFIAKHEWGHAAFHMGDEYTEYDSTRRVTVDPPAFPLPSSCCCEVVDTTSTGGTGGTPGGGPGTGLPGQRIKQCFSPDGGSSFSPVGVTLDPPPSCSDLGSLLGRNCGMGTEPNIELCPSLAGNCVARSAWLTRIPPPGANTARPNVFATEGDCTTAVAKAGSHPGVENPQRSIGACRELCGPNTSACPCGAAQFWIADLNPLQASAPANLRDVMAAVSPGERHGGTCAWCVETSLCVRWNAALGHDSQKIWDNCNTPVSDSTLQAFVRGVGELILRVFAAIFGNVIP